MVLVFFVGCRLVIVEGFSVMWFWHVIFSENAVDGIRVATKYTIQI